MEETTFCFVTTHIWKHKQGTVEATVEKTAEKKWRGVRILDANSLQMWLEICPLSAIWFADIIGKSIEDNSTLLQKELCEKKPLGSIWRLVAADIIALVIDFTLIKLMLGIFRNEGILAIEKGHLYMTMVVMAITSWLGAITYQLLIGKRPLNIYKQGSYLYFLRLRDVPVAERKWILALMMKVQLSVNAKIMEEIIASKLIILNCDFCGIVAFEYCKL